MLSFFILAFAIGWIPWVVRIYNPGFQFQVFVFAPLAAALVVSAAIGIKELKQWLLRIIHWRVRWWWYAIALILPIFIKEMASTINLMIGATAMHGNDYIWKSFLENFRPAFLLPLVWILCEESGWRGFATPRLLERYPVLVTGLLMGLIWSIWNLPLILTGEITIMELVKGIAHAIILTAIIQATKGSVVICILLLASNNIIARIYFGLFEGENAARLDIILVILWWGIALMMALITNWQGKKISTDIVNRKAVIQ